VNVSLLVLCEKAGNDCLIVFPLLIGKQHRPGKQCAKERVVQRVLGAGHEHVGVRDVCQVGGKDRLVNVVKDVKLMCVVPPSKTKVVRVSRRRELRNVSEFDPRLEKSRRGYIPNDEFSILCGNTQRCITVKHPL
jgi:hypothetical protein